MAYNESCCNIYHRLSTYYSTVSYFMVHRLLYSIVFWKISCGNFSIVFVVLEMKGSSLIESIIDDFCIPFCM